MNLTAILPYILQLLHDAMGSAWGPLMVLISGWLVQLLSDDSKFPISMPKAWDSNQWKPAVVVIASVVQGIVVSIIQGHTDPLHAVLLGLRTAVWTLGLWSLIVKAIWNGKPPAWVNWFSAIATPPVAVKNVVEREAVTLSGKDAFPSLPPPPPPKKPPTPPSAA